MILTHSVKVCLATQPCDLRKSFDALSCVVAEQLNEDPFSSKLFVFLNKRADRVKMLITLGLVMLASASAKWDLSVNQYSYLVRQAIWLAIGVVVMTVMALLDYRILQKLTWPLFFGVCIVLILCYIPGIGDTAKGESRWIVLPVIGRFQPSEPAKHIIMIALAS